MIRRSIFIFVTLIIFLAGCSHEPDKNTLKIQDSPDSSLSVEPEKNTSKTQTPADSDQSEPRSENQIPLDSNQNKPTAPSTDEEILMKPPGRFAGSNYDEQKVKAALDQLPNDLTADQYTEELLLLLGEDYSSYITTFKEYDTEIKVDIERPNGNITLPASRKLHISILLDASGSMKAQINGKSKMDSAKDAIQIFADKLPENAEVSLRVYGHKGTGSQKDKQVSCNSTEEIFHGQGNQTNQIKTALQSVKPAGWTPIANALKSVKQDINPETTDSVVYVVSDGIETCGGNPVQIAKELNQSKVKTIVNIIGFNVDNEGQKLLRQVATSGGGEFTSVDNDESLKNVLNKAYIKLLGEWQSWQARGEGQANTQKEQKQGAFNTTETKMQILANKEYDNLLKALRYLQTKYGTAIPQDVYLQITERKSLAWNYARITKRRLYDEVAKNGKQVYDDFKNEGDKNIEDLKNKQNN
ncbi:VWA domain-containing protein [Paenibacillus sp. KQZ6P-2]|uniref:VWA domain-containing protein n=1 Tax=Paenibacillus mangrovi TaxID=2931978 RepID=A0A9X2B102_9BACL|nr:VWA domain-containing protein [Paenibacillus mangrovi]MCJ8011009.1 VWA domain-containing protein [Paenibacillus mangrovi]